MNIFNKIVNTCRILCNRFKGVAISFSAKVASGIYLKLTPIGIEYGAISIADKCDISRGAVIKSYGGKVTLNQNVFLGEYVIIYGHGGVEIGSNTLIAMHTCIVSSNHTIPGTQELIRSKPDILMPVHIGKDVWIGAGCKILGGVTIGDGCVVGAGSIVNKDLPPYSISAGSPARVIKYRE
jgi:acetyltransferase-like isoleucine patch superfamily enzyme